MEQVTRQPLEGTVEGRLWDGGVEPFNTHGFKSWTIDTPATQATSKAPRTAACRRVFSAVT